MTSTVNTKQIRSVRTRQAQLSQGGRATAAWVSFGQNITGRGYSAPNTIGLYLTPSPIWPIMCLVGR